MDPLMGIDQAEIKLINDTGLPVCGTDSSLPLEGPGAQPYQSSDCNGSAVKLVDQSPPLLVDAWLVPLFFALIMLVGLVGNSLVIHVITKHRQMRTVTNFYIANLATTDILFLVCCVPFTATLYPLPSWVFGDFMCRIVNYLQQVTAQATCITLTAMSMDRCYATVYPLQSLRHRTSRVAMAVSVGIWIGSFVLSVPVAAYQTLDTGYWYGPQTYCIEAFPSVYHQKTFILYTFLAVYLLPLVTICVCYAFMLKRMSRPVVEPSDNNYQVTAQATCITLTAMSVDRCYATVYPLQSLRHRTPRVAMAVSVGIWIGSFVLSVPVAAYQTLDTGYWYGPQTYCIEAFPSVYHQKTFILYTFLAVYLLPLVTICVCYAFMLKRMSRPVVEPSDNNYQVQLLAERSEAIRTKISKMVVVIVVLFTICWGPIQFFILFQAFDSNFQKNYETYKIKIWAHCMSYSNSSVNPIVYAFMGANFRKSFKKAFPFIFKQRVGTTGGAVVNTEMHFVSSGT
ncbi:G-protein coupled receptor 54 [Acipenser ruthenus]|uniref:G-protein coupled receptor 54 n=1 Tax=Acipenser ruthenus TaxID=7906 RepID=A0A444U203_ACIRT|nr:G-protein coupled receptor 54 [Acipenser ruthenus]